MTTPEGYGPKPPTVIKSWEQQVQDADPEWRQRLLRPVIYEFSSGRVFVKDPQVYTD